MKFDTGKLEFKTPYLWGLFIAWVAWGQFVTYCVMYDHVPPFILDMANSVASSVPSIIRLNSKHDHYVFGVFLAQRIVALAMLSMPLLFILLLLADVGESISGVRRKRKELMGMALFIAVGLGVFLLSFGVKGPGRIFHTSIFAFSFLSSSMIYLSAYAFRLFFALINKP